MRRASGKAEDALILYREQLTIDPADKTARAGVVLSLLDLGKKEEAERELLRRSRRPQNVALLVGASYWHASKGDAARAQELAVKAIEMSRLQHMGALALARAHIAQKRRLRPSASCASRASTEIFQPSTTNSSALAASGLYEEAARDTLSLFHYQGRANRNSIGRARRSARREL